jgi:hypothetical protein
VCSSKNCLQLQDLEEKEYLLLRIGKQEEK